MAPRLIPLRRRCRRRARRRFVAFDKDHEDERDQNLAALGMLGLMGVLGFRVVQGFGLLDASGFESTKVSRFRLLGTPTPKPEIRSPRLKSGLAYSRLKL